MRVSIIFSKQKHTLDGKINVAADAELTASKKAQIRSIAWPMCMCSCANHQNPINQRQKKYSQIDRQ